MISPEKMMICCKILGEFIVYFDGEVGLCSQDVANRAGDKMRHPGWPGRLGMHRMVNGLLVCIYIYICTYVYIYIYCILCSMYSIFTYIWVIFRANVGQYSIHGAYYGIHVQDLFGNGHKS